MKRLFLLLFVIILVPACQKTVEKKASEEDIISTLKQSAVNLQDAILAQNSEEFNKYVDNSITYSTGDSNLSKFYVMSTETLGEEQVAKWGEFELYDINVALSPDSETAVLTFYARGDYSVGGGDKVDYGTRASSVWISTENGWKIMHSNWAPYGGGNGIPK